MARKNIVTDYRRVLPAFRLKRGLRTVMSTVGGKERIADNLMRCAPSDVSVIAIPCMGGMSYGVAIARRYAPERDVKIIMSDIDRHMVNYAHVLRREPLRFAGHVNGLRERYQNVSKGLFTEAMEVLTNDVSPFHRAIGFHLYRWTVWPQAQFSFRPTAYSPGRAHRALSKSRIRQLPLLGELLSRMEIHEESYERTFERVAAVGRKAFLPIDPPYFGKDRLLYECDFDQERFARNVSDLDCNVLITMDTSDAAVMTYQGYKRAFYSMSYGGNARKRGIPKPRGIEQIACNYEPPFFALTVKELGWMTEERFLIERVRSAANDDESVGPKAAGAGQ